MNFKKAFVLSALISLLVTAASAQNAALSQNSSQTPQSQPLLPMGYGGIQLGMTVEEVKAALVRNTQFGYRGDRDVSLLPGDNRVIIETDTSRTNASSFLTQCYFQFYNERLYIITINVKPEKMDYYSIFSTLCSKYGNPPSMNPRKSQWQDDAVIMTLEKPLSLKYMDRSVYEGLMNESMVLQSGEEMSRELFLEGL